MTYLFHERTESVNLDKKTRSNRALFAYQKVRNRNVVFSNEVSSFDKKTVDKENLTPSNIITLSCQWVKCEKLYDLVCNWRSTCAHGFVLVTLWKQQKILCEVGVKKYHRIFSHNEQWNRIDVIIESSASVPMVVRKFASLILTPHAPFLPNRSADKIPQVSMCQRCLFHESHTHSCCFLCIVHGPIHLRFEKLAAMNRYYWFRVWVLHVLRCRSSTNGKRHRVRPNWSLFINFRPSFRFCSG
jgi:hypothetical protein